MKIDYQGTPTHSLEELLDMFKLDSYLILDEVFSSKKNYQALYQGILDILKLGFEKDEIRHRPIMFKFHHTDKEVHQLKMTNFLSNLILWYPFMEMGKEDILDESYIFDFAQFNQNSLLDYMNNKILPNHTGTFSEKNACIDEICYNMIAVSNTFCLLIGMTLSMRDFMDVEARNPEMTELMFADIDTTKQPNEIEQELAERTDRLIDIFVKDTVMNDLKPMFLSGKNLSRDQFKEIAVRIGFKADKDGHTIAIPLNTNYLIGGLNKPSSIYINAISGRKALAVVKTQMGTPGAFSKKLNYNVTSAAYLRKDDDMCDSTAFIDYEIVDDEFLLHLDGRYYYDKHGEMKILNYNEDKHLIGKVVPFRSPCTCSSEDGICRYCYGHLFDINSDLFSVGALASTKSSEPLGQGTLSTKHNQTTHSEAISFNEEFDRDFELNSDEISVKEDTDNDDELYIMMDNVQSEESDDQEFLYTNEYKVVDAKGKIIYTVTEDHGSNMYLSPELSKAYKKTRDHSKPISLEGLDSDAVLFNIEVKNSETTDPIKIIQRLLNNKTISNHTLSEACQILSENFLKIGVKYDFVHFECIIRSLLRKKSNKLEFPDWSENGNHEDYQLLRLNGALFDNPSPLVSITYGYLRKQLISPELYEKRAASHIDPFFVPQLSSVLTNNDGD